MTNEDETPDEALPNEILLPLYALFAVIFVAVIIVVGVYGT